MSSPSRTATAPILSGNSSVASTHPTTEEERAFLQCRVGLFGMGFAILSGFFVVVRTIMALVMDFMAEFDDSYVLHIVGTLCFVSVWILCRGKTRSAEAVRTIETVGFLSGSLAFAAMGYHIPVVNRPEMIMVLAITFACFARAVYVPSSGRRTFSLTTLAGLPILVVAYLVYQTDAAWPLIELFDVTYPGSTPSRAGMIAVVFSATWWTLTVASCTSASKVIYGLRQQVQDVRKLGQYTLERKLGEGGMGVVYEASHAMLRRPTAVKLLSPERSGDHALSRFEREVQLTARLTHPNTVTVYDYGRTPDGVFYYAMELLDGLTLSELVEIDGPQDAARVVHVLRAAAGALAEAHQVGLIHRDVKPANIMLCRRGGLSDVAKVLDFGLVKELNPSQDVSLTQADALTGTPQYISPEAIKDPEQVDARSDVYALGAVGYYLLTGQHVFTGKTLVEICGHHLHTPPEPPDKRLGKPVPASIQKVVLDCLAKDQTGRPATAAKLIERLDACKDVGTWDHCAMDAWWDTHGEQIKSDDRTARSVATDRTIAIDLARRTDRRVRN